MIPNTVASSLSCGTGTKNEPVGTISGTTTIADMETKCTQTKLDDQLEPHYLPLTGGSASFNSSTCGSSVENKTTTSTIVDHPNLKSGFSEEPEKSGSKSGSTRRKSESANEV